MGEDASRWIAGVVEVCGNFLLIISYFSGKYKASQHLRKKVRKDVIVV